MLAHSVAGFDLGRTARPPLGKVCISKYMYSLVGVLEPSSFSPLSLSLSLSCPTLIETHRICLTSILSQKLLMTQTLKSSISKWRETIVVTLPRSSLQIREKVRNSAHIPVGSVFVQVTRVFYKILEWGLGFSWAIIAQVYFWYENYYFFYFLLIP